MPICQLTGTKTKFLNYDKILPFFLFTIPLRLHLREPMVSLYSRPAASLKTRRFMWGVMLLCVANYLAHLFPISLMSTLGWLTDSVRAERSDISSSQLLQVTAWFEFFFVTILLLFLAVLLALFVTLREGLRLIVGGWDALTMNGSEYLLIFAGPVIAASFPLMLMAGGEEALAGTRAAGAGIHTLMFVTAFFTTCSIAYNVGLALEPKAFRGAVER